MTKSTCSCEESLVLETALGRAVCFGPNSPSDVIAPSRITGGGEPSPHEGGPIRNCLRWEPACQGRGSAGSCSCPGPGSPLPCGSSASGTPLGPAHSPSCRGVWCSWFLLAVHWFSLQQVRRRSLQEALLGPLCVMGVVEGFLSPGRPPPPGRLGALKEKRRCSVISLNTGGVCICICVFTCSHGANVCSLNSSSFCFISIFN